MTSPISASIALSTYVRARSTHATASLFNRSSGLRTPCGVAWIQCVYLTLLWMFQSWSSLLSGSMATALVRRTK
ncbi:hypothetical protein M438DRAFT_348762 [Aureobasidium pullulans EXF-150]|uniref:Uncharacterized protein n=1 Tax=Aureobasidium pullulans EXF-150 TaxID=1043002 RepID=A0A074Y0V3_AURPU|nr:uncharacterized protein M438DRAFT_348762 [Aureobasidium pullulans EXF-150]KEQ80526.1 hypothetical protein M438DRAFT_348762 [Aureobasidium pullulans EXF-150]